LQAPAAVSRLRLDVELDDDIVGLGIRGDRGRHTRAALLRRAIS
jgi:hypothetical protein